MRNHYIPRDKQEKKGVWALKKEEYCFNTSYSCHFENPENRKVNNQ